MRAVKHSILAAAACCAFAAVAAEYPVKKVAEDLAKVPAVSAAYWDAVPEVEVALLGQMIAKPGSPAARTPKVRLQAVHDGKRAAFRLRWSDTARSEAGKLAEFSDAAALQFPVLDKPVPPPIMMGAAGDPVHLFHWRAQYQRDETAGMKTIKDIYPNLSSDIYPNEFPDRGKLKPATEAELETFSTGKAAGNPQSYPKKAVDEILAEGFGTSAAIPGNGALGRGEWKDGAWTVVISRPLACPGGSTLAPGKPSNLGVAIWQGSEGEVGSRKSITMMWTPFRLEEK